MPSEKCLHYSARHSWIGIPVFPALSEVVARQRVSPIQLSVSRISPKVSALRAISSKHSDSLFSQRKGE
jgi:hypothetical protein